MPVIPPKARKTYGRIAVVAAQQGWTITLTAGGHVRWASPTGAVVFSPTTPSDRRARRNTIARLRRSGLVVP